MSGRRSEPAAGDRLLGVHAVTEALEAGRRRFDHVMVQRGRHDRRIARLLELARERGVPVRQDTRAALDRLAGGLPHQGVVGLAGAVGFAGEDEVLAAIPAAEAPFLLVLDGVEDPRNLGAVLRSAAAAGAHGVFVPERGSAPLSAAALRAASGAAERLPVCRIGNVAALLNRLKKKGIWTIGLVPEGAPLWDGFDWEEGIALVIGREGTGLRRLVREGCDRLLAIPMPGGGGSLNLSVAAGVALFEVVRRRGGAAS